MNSTPTNYIDTVDNVMLYITGVSTILLIGITVVMIYFVFKYHRKKGHKPVDIHGNWILETIWIVIPTILVLSMFYFGYMGYEQLRDVPDDAMVIKATARMWDWDFDYENGKKTDTLYVPLGYPVKLELYSVDVNHSLYIPAFRMKEDVIPGRNNFLAFRTDQIGSYDIACAEYCGLDHSQMYTKLVVVSEDQFYEWYNKKEETADSSAVKSDSLKADKNEN